MASSPCHVTFKIPLALPMSSMGKSPTSLLAARLFEDTLHLLKLLRALHIDGLGHLRNPVEKTAMAFTFPCLDMLDSCMYIHMYTHI